ARTAVYIADIRERAPKFLLEQRKMGAGKDNGVDSRAIGRLEHWLRPVLNGVDPDRLPGELGFGQLDQLGGAVADDRAVAGELRGEVVDIGLAHRCLGAE